MPDWLDNMIGVGNLPTDITNPTVDFTDPSVWNWQTNLGPDDRPITIDTSDAVVPPASLPGGVETADQTYRTSPGSANLTDWAKIVKALTSPAGIAGLGGAALGFLDRPKPSGGGTTMAYPGAAKLERKMVQGPYGPLAEYTGVGGGAPDYTPFVAPTFGAPDVGGRPPTTPAPGPGAGMSVQSKVDLYKQMRGYGLSDARARRIAESMFGPQTDSDWAELGRLAGMTGGIAGAATLPARVTTPPPGGITALGGTTPPGGITAPNVGSVVMGGPPPVASPAPAPAPAQVSSGFNTRAAADYIKYRKLPGTEGGSASAIRSMLERDYGPQSQEQLDAYEKAYQEHMDYQAKLAAAPASAPAPAPAPAPVAAAAAAPAADMSEGYKFATQPGGIGIAKYYENIADFLRKNPTEEEIRAAMKEYGVSDLDVRRAQIIHELPGRRFAQGGPVQMEDGGFVLTKRAVDGAGGPRGIQQLVPGARMIRGPGTGTSDDIPAVINGRNGQTPARLSNGEAYVPKRFVQAQGGPQRMYALMNNLQRKA